jgi:hypothetical protein
MNTERKYYRNAIWTTVIQRKVGRKWELFSQQGTLPGEQQFTDEQYLIRLRRIYPAETLRIRPEDHP